MPPRHPAGSWKEKTSGRIRLTAAPVSYHVSEIAAKKQRHCWGNHLSGGRKKGPCFWEHLVKMGMCSGSAVPGCLPSALPRCLPAAGSSAKCPRAAPALGRGSPGCPMLTAYPPARGSAGDPSCPPVSWLLESPALAPALPEHQIQPLAAPGAMHPPARGEAVGLQPSRS